MTQTKRKTNKLILCYVFFLVGFSLKKITWIIKYKLQISTGENLGVERRILQDWSSMPQDLYEIPHNKTAIVRFFGEKQKVY